MHAVKIKVIDNFILICTGTDRLDLITSYLFRELTYSTTIQRKGKGFFFLNQPFHSKEKNVLQHCECQCLGKGVPPREPEVLCEGSANQTPGFILCTKGLQ